MPGKSFPALSVRQPWADLIVDGIKDVENRSWPARFRGTILIHAPRKVDWEAVERLQDLLGPRESYQPVTGAIVGMTEIVDCVAQHPGRFFTGPYGFVLRNSRRFPEPVPLPGRLGIFEVPQDLLQGSPAAGISPGGSTEPPSAGRRRPGGL